MPHSPRGAIAAALDTLSATLDGVDADATAHLLELLATAPAVFMAGAGRSGLLARCAAMRLMHLGKSAHIVGDTLVPPLRSGDLLLIVSGSGETAGMVALARKARELGAGLAVVTANPASTLAGLADAVVALDVSNATDATHPMGSLFEQTMFLLLESMIPELMRRSGQTSADMFKRHANLE